MSRSSSLWRMSRRSLAPRMPLRRRLIPSQGQGGEGPTRQSRPSAGTPAARGDRHRTWGESLPVLWWGVARHRRARRGASRQDPGAVARDRDAAPSTQRRCSPASPACCRSMAMPDTTLWPASGRTGKPMPGDPAVRSCSPIAGATSVVASTTSPRPVTRRSPARSCTASARYTRSRPRYPAAPPKSAAQIDRRERSLSPRPFASGSTSNSNAFPGRSPIAEAMRYGTSHWQGLCRFLDDGRVEIDTNVVERTIRPIALNRKNALFAGSTR